MSLDNLLTACLSSKVTLVTCSWAPQRVTPTPTSQRSSPDQAFYKVVTAAPPATGNDIFSRMGYGSQYYLETLREWLG